MVRVGFRAALAAAVVAAPAGAPLAAQDKAQDTKAATVPESAMPPAGMCRVWLRDVPERQQPAPTDCAAAIKTLPRDAMVLFGDLKRAARLSPSAGAVPTSRQQSARELRGYRAPGVAPADGRAGQQQGRASGAAAATGVLATALGGAAAAPKAPETKAVIKPERPR